MVKSKVQKWGNSLAIRLPKAYADQLGIEAGSDVEVALGDDHLSVIPNRKRASALARLLRKITPANVHGEIETGSPTGRESW